MLEDVESVEQSSIAGGNDRESCYRSLQAITLYVSKDPTGCTYDMQCVRKLVGLCVRLGTPQQVSRDLCLILCDCIYLLVR